MEIKNTLFVGKVLHHFPLLDSTNNYAAQLLLQKDIAEGTLVITDYQFAGRGQRGNQWESSAEKNIMMSIILFPKFLKPTEQFWLTIITALSVCKVVQDYLPEQDVKIKWPNDILISNKKTAGILIQNTFSGVQIQSSIIGIGLNVNQIHFPEALSSATSLSRVSHQTLDLEPIINDICHQLEAHYLKLRSQQRNFLLTDYYQHLFKYNEVVSFNEATGQLFEGTIKGVTDTGRLIVNINGKDKDFGLKEIKYILF